MHCAKCQVQYFAHILKVKYFCFDFIWRDTLIIFISPHRNIPYGYEIWNQISVLKVLKKLSEKKRSFAYTMLPSTTPGHWFLTLWEPSITDKSLRQLMAAWAMFSGVLPSNYWLYRLWLACEVTDRGFRQQALFPGQTAIRGWPTGIGRGCVSVDFLHT